MTATRRLLLAASSLVAVGLIACSSQLEPGADTIDPWASGAEAGAGGSGNEGGSDAVGMAGTNGEGGSGLTEVGGSGGSSNTGGFQGGGPDDGKATTCPGLYQQKAPWPGEGRCADRAGRAAGQGPRSFGAKREISLETPVRTTPVVGADHVFVATEKGVYRVDRDFAQAPLLVLEGRFGSTPVLTESLVFAVATNGVLHFTSQTAIDATTAQTLDLRGPTDVAQPDPAAPWLSAPLLTATELLVATPWGHIARVDMTEPTAPITAARVTTAGQLGAPRAALATDSLGATYLPTNIGLFRVSSDGVQLTRLGESAVPMTPVGTGRGMIFIDAAGVLHETVAIPGQPSAGEPNVPDDDATHVDDLVEDFPGQALATGPGAIGGLGQLRFSVTSGKSVRILTVSDVDRSGPTLDSLDDSPFFSTTGPIDAAVSADSTGVQYVASTDGNLYIVNTDGALLDSYLTGGALVAQPAVIDGAVYLGSTDGTVYRLSEGP